MNKKYKISVVTVTYGRRWNFLFQCLNSIKDNNLVSDIIVVDNGSYEDIETLCKALNNSKIKVVKTGKNLGSAGGFYAGIKFAYEQGKGDFIFLLDDDNVVEVNCLENLLGSFVELGEDFKKCFKAFKIDNKTDLKLLKYGNYLDLINCALGFHIMSKLRQFFLKKNSDQINTKKLSGGVPYSGFLFDKNAVKEVGLPNRNMILYADDIEYSLRFLRKGFSIYLVPCAILKDLDIIWHHKNLKFNPCFAPSTDPIRAYYSIRNRVYLEKKYLLKNMAVYFLNFFLYFGYSFIIALFYEKDKRAVLKRGYFLLKATYHGWQGKLGQYMDLKKLK